MPHDSPATLLQFDAEDIGKTQTGSPQRRRQMHVGYVTIGDYRQLAVIRKRYQIDAYSFC